MHAPLPLHFVIARAATVTALAVCAAAVFPAQVIAQGVGAQPSSAWTAVDQALGRSGAMQPGDVMRYSFPRSDLQVTAAGVALKPALALGSWVGFKNVSGGHRMVMGALVP